MGIYGSFLGQGDGYTRAQRTGLRRSAGIKKERREEKSALEREKLRSAETQERMRGQVALTERRMMESGQTGRRRSTETGLMAREQLSQTSQTGRQRMIGEQQWELAGRAEIAAANLASMERGHEKTLAEMESRAKASEGPGDYESFTETVPGTLGGKERTGFFSPSTNVTKYPRSPGDVAGETGMADFSKVGEPTISKLYGMSEAEQSQYLDWLEKNDPKGFMALREEYTKLMAPKKEESPY